MENLEEKLLRDNWVTLEQLALATQEAERLNKSIWVALAKLGILTQEDIAIFFAQESGIPYVRISDYQIRKEVINLVDEDFCRQNLVLPLFKIKDILFVACANPLDTTVIDELMSKTALDIEPLIANPDSIIQAQDYYYGLKNSLFALESFVRKQRPVHSLPFYRASERVPLNLPVWLTVEDDGLALHSSSPIEGITRDISYGGTSIGLNIFLFIPKGTIVMLEFRLGNEPSLTSKAKGEVVYCRMEKGLRYFLGVMFLEIEDAVRNGLLRLVEKNP